LKKDKTKTVSCSAAKGLKLKSGFVKERFAQKIKEIQIIFKGIIKEK
jgi:hypothetical protein